MLEKSAMNQKKSMSYHPVKVRQVAAVFGLLARSSFLKLLGVIFIMAIGEIVLFWHEMSVRSGTAEQSVGELGTNDVTIFVTAPEKLVEYALLPLFFLAALALVMVVLIWTEVRMSEKAGYTMMRLGLSRKELFAIKTIYNVACLVLLFVVQIWLAIGLLAWYRTYIPVGIDMPQLFFLSFYRSKFLHCLLPMQEIGKWIRNLLMIVALAMTAAGVIVFPGEKGVQRSASCGSVVILAVMWFVSDAGKNLLDMCCDILFLGVIVWEFLKIFGVFGRTEATVEEKDA